MITNIIAKLVVMVVTNWVSYEGFRLEYENNTVLVNATYTPSQNNAVYTPYQPKLIFDEKTECPWVNQVTASTNNYSRVGEVIRIEKYVFPDGKEMEKSREVVGRVRQVGKKIVKTRRFRLWMKSARI